MNVDFARSTLLVGVLLVACDGREAVPAADATVSWTDAGSLPDASLPRTARIFAFNDFHGAIAQDDTRAGAGALAATIEMLRAGGANSIIVSAGDLIGGSPLESGYWHDEPTIEAMSALGLSLNAIGNHELDDGPDELLRLLEGGRCHFEGCGPRGAPVAAAFESLAANTFTDASGETLLPPYAIRELGGVRVAFVGLTLESTAEIALGAATLRFGDEADTVNALVPELRGLGVTSIVVLMHEGGEQSGGISACDGIAGAVVDIVRRMDAEIDVVVTGHTHQSYVCEIDGHLVTSAGSNGNLVTSIDLSFDVDGDIGSAIATNIRVARDATPTPTVAAIVAEWVDATRELGARVVGTVTAGMARGTPELCAFNADAMLEGARVADPTADFALTNIGGIRGAVAFPASPTGGGAGEVTFGELYAVHPFGNQIVVVSLTGREVLAVLDESAGTSGLCPSRALTFRWTGTRTVAGSVRVDGVAIDLDATYRVATSDYLFGGGEGYAGFALGRERLPGMLLIEALERLLATSSPYTPDTTPRITP